MAIWPAQHSTTRARRARARRDTTTVVLVSCRHYVPRSRHSTSTKAIFRVVPARGTTAHPCRARPRARRPAAEGEEEAAGAGGEEEEVDDVVHDTRMAMTGGGGEGGRRVADPPRKGGVGGASPREGEVTSDGSLRTEEVAGGGYPRTSAESVWRERLGRDGAESRGQRGWPGGVERREGEARRGAVMRHKVEKEEGGG
jgi:hypothetical protein